MFTRSAFKIFLWIFPLLLTTLACQAASNFQVSEKPVSSQPPESVQQVIPVSGQQPAYCPDILSTIVNAAATAEGDAAPSAESRLVSYLVQGNQISDPYFDTVPDALKDEQNDLSTQQAVWNYFSTIIPEKDRTFLTQYAVITDGKDNLLAAVAQTADDPSKWTLEVDVADSKNYENLTFTLIHEFGHLLTLNTSQVTPDLKAFRQPRDSEVYKQEAAICPNYFPGEGCSNANSYINQFYQRFWTGIYAEWSQVDQEQDELAYYIKLTDFYAKHEDQFVSDYAATNAGEDIAESWAYFVLSPKPEGNTIAEQKILFFYQYPELVQLRQEILNNLCNAFP